MGNRIDVFWWAGENKRIRILRCHFQWVYPNEISYNGSWITQASGRKSSEDMGKLIRLSVPTLKFYTGLLTSKIC